MEADPNMCAPRRATGERRGDNAHALWRAQWGAWEPARGGPCAPCVPGSKSMRRARTQIVKKGDPDAGAAGGKRRRNALSDLRREVAIMRTLRHRNIVTLQARPAARGCHAVTVAGSARGAPGRRRSTPASLQTAALLGWAAAGGGWPQQDGMAQLHDLPPLPPLPVGPGRAARGAHPTLESPLDLTLRRRWWTTLAATRCCW